MTDPIFPDATVTPTPTSPRLHALVPCGGRGSRAGDGGPKQYRMVGDRTVLGHTLMALTTVSRLHTVLVVLAPDDDGFDSPSVQSSLPPSDGRVHLCRQAGATRAHTVANGLRWLRNHGAHESDWVLVHDAARCLVTPADVNALIDACLARQIGGLLAVPLADTLKSAHADRVQATVGRDDKWLAQTPQMFRLGELAEALDRSAADDHRHITDEASAIEAMGQHPLLVTGSADNFKLTYPPDFARAEAILRARAHRGGPSLRMGEGWDCHALVPGRPLMLGGVCIPHTHGLLGHSDADVLLHAITDAVLGAAGLGDIGRHFPDTDVRFKGADSKVLLTEAMARVQAAGWRLVNLDATVVAQAPKLARYMPAMVDSVASCLGVSAGQVNLKAKTAERLGPVGQGLSLEARAVALLTSIG